MAGSGASERATMPVISGTTARQAEAMGRWLLVFLWVIGSVMWWWPGYRVWGAMAAGEIAVLGIWLSVQILLGRRRAPGHPMHWSWVVPAGVIVWHLTRQPLLGGEHSDLGGVVASAAFHLMLAAGALMLVQCVLSLELINRPGVVSVTALALTAGGLAAWGTGTPVVAPATTMLGLAGSLLAVAAAWPRAWWAMETEDHPRRRRRGRWWAVWRGLVAGVAGAGAIALSIGFPREALVAAGALGVACLVAGAFGSQKRAIFLAVGTALTGGAVASLTVLHAWSDWGLCLPVSWLGEGDNVFSRLHADASGVSLLGGMLGWVGMGALAAGLAWTVARLWRLGGPCRGGEAIGRVLWAAGALTACAGIAMPGGLFVPSTVLAVGLGLGLMPAAFRAEVSDRPAWVVGIVVAAGVIAGGFAGAGGLARWSAAAIGGEDTWPHILTGFLSAMILAWWWGWRRTWAGLVGVVVAVLIGAGGELAQEWFTVKGGEWHDWGFHTLGCLPAVIVLVLGRRALRCELPDARARDLVSGSHRWRTLPRGHGR